MLLNFTFNNRGPSCNVDEPTRLACISSAEAHALGFAHEHNRADTPSTCTQPRQGHDGDRRRYQGGVEELMRTLAGAKVASRELPPTLVGARTSFNGRFVNPSGSVPACVPRWTPYSPSPPSYPLG